MADHPKEFLVRLPPPWRWAAAWLATALGLGLLGRLGALTVLPGDAALALWPAAGLGLALILTAGPRILPGLAAGLLLASFPAAMARGGLGPGPAAALAAALAAGHVLEVMTAHAILRRLASAWPFDRQRKTLLFILAALAAALLGATLGCAAQVAAGLSPLPQVPATFIAWWLTESSALLVFTPIFFGLVARDRPPLPTARLIELAGALALVTGISLSVVAGSPSTLSGAAATLILPVLIWCAYRLGAWGAALGTGLTGILTLPGAIQGVGIFGAGPPAELVLGHLLSMTLIGATALLLAATVSELRTARARLLDVNEDLTARVQARAKNLIRSNLAFTREAGDRRRAEAALRESEARFRNLVDNLPQTVFEFDFHGRFTFLNATATTMFGYTPEDLAAGLNVLDVLHPEDRDRAQGNIGRQMAGAGLLGGEYRCLHRDGRTVPVRIYSHVILQEGRPAGVRGIVLDISDIKRTECELAEKEEKYRALVELLPLALVIFQGGKMVFANPAAAETFGFATTAEMLGRNPFEQFPAEVQPRIRDLARRRMQGEPGLPTRYETTLLKADGRSFHAEVTVQVIEFNGHPAHQVICQDVSERKRAETALRLSHAELERQVAARTQELTAANQRLTEINAQMSSFLSSASHELRTPLTSILGFARMIEKLFSRHFADLVRSDQVLNHKGRLIMEDAGIIVQEGKRLSRLVSDLLDLNRIESGRMQWRDEDLDLAELLRHTAAAVAGAFAARRDLTLRTTLPETLPRVHADRDRVEQVVLNLLHNALKFTRDGNVELAAGVRDGRVEVRVTDTGPGVPELERRLIFQKFYQMRPGDGDRSKPRGTGLGLAICQQIVEHYDGELWVESGPDGHGSSFAFCLPAHATGEGA